MAKAEGHARTLGAVREGQSQGMSGRTAVKTYAPGVPRSTLQFWERRDAMQEEGHLDGGPPDWEGQLDLRVPPVPASVPEPVRTYLIALREVERPHGV